MTLYQNVLAEIQLSFAVMAAYFQTYQTSATGGEASVAVISTFLMLPVGVLIPWMFAVRFFRVFFCMTQRILRIFATFCSWRFVGVVSKSAYPLDVYASLVRQSDHEQREWENERESTNDCLSHSADPKRAQAAQSFLSRTVHEMIQHHKQIKKEMTDSKRRMSNAEKLMSEGVRRMSENRLSKQKKGKSLWSAGHKHSTGGKISKVHPLSDESFINTPLQSIDSSSEKVVLNGTARTPASAPTNQRSKPSSAAVSTEQQNLHTKAETPPSNIFDVTAKALDVEIVHSPGPTSLHPSADTHAGQLSKSSAVALSAERQNIWNKAKQALDIEERE